MSKNVAILGCGPAGIFAAWAARRAGYQVRIISNKRRSEMFGAQYLHKPIPGVFAEKRTIEYKLIGTADGYRDRVYGSEYAGKVSPEEISGEHTAWDIRSSYYMLYEEFEDVIDHTPRIDAEVLTKAISHKAWRDYDHVFNTIPLNSICHNRKEHRFRSQRIWARGDAPERGVLAPIACADETVICNGEPIDSTLGWYRISRVFGHSTVEWPSWYYPPLNGEPAAEVLKPIDNTCDCYANILPLGRYGKWTKGVLSHEAFYEVEELLK